MKQKDRARCPVPGRSCGHRHAGPRKQRLGQVGRLPRLCLANGDKRSENDEWVTPLVNVGVCRVCAMTVRESQQIERSLCGMVDIVIHVVIASRQIRNQKNDENCIQNLEDSPTDHSSGYQEGQINKISR